MRAMFTIPGKLPGLNEIIKASRTHYVVANSQKKKYQKIISNSILLSQIKPFTEPVVLAFKWVEPDNRRDRGNIRAGEKFISDALVLMGILPNDTAKWVKGFADYFPDPDKKNPHIEVTVETLDESPSEQNGKGGSPPLAPGFEGVWP